MFTRYHETREKFAVVAKRTNDSADKALAVYEAAKARWHGLRASHPPRTLAAYQRYAERLREGETAVLAALDMIFATLDAHPRWIYCVRNRTCGDFYVKTVAEAVAVLERFEARTGRGAILKGRALVEWRSRRLSTIKSALLPIRLGLRGLSVPLENF